MPVQGHFALTDPYFPPGVVDGLEAKLKQGGVPYEFYRYQANHAFGHKTGGNYDHEAAELAWKEGRVSADELSGVSPRPRGRS